MLPYQKTGEEMEFAHSQERDLRIVKVSGRMDINSSAAFEKEIQGCLAEVPGAIVIDMTELEYISSAGLRSILVSAKAARTVGSEIRFCGVVGMVDEVFTISGFKKMFKIFDSLIDASAE